MKRSAPLPLTSLAVALALATFGCSRTGAEAEASAAPPPKVAQVAPGEAFPAGSYANLNPDPGGTIDLGGTLGSEPVLLYYWIAGNARSEELFRQLEALVGEVGGERLALYGVAVPRPNAGAAAISARVRALGLRSPVIEDLDFQIGQRLGVMTVPHIALIDREGRLQLSNGASLKQSVDGGLDLEAVIRSTAATGSLETYGALARYFPVRELEGSRCPDFRAPRLTDSVEQTWSALIDHNKLNLLVFWSVDCPHCRHSLPEINDSFRRNSDWLNVVSAAKVTDEASRIKTRQFCDLNDFGFPTLVDDSDLTELFKVTSTPTILVIRPDGVIDSAFVSAVEDFGAAIEQKRREILGS